MCLCQFALLKTTVSLHILCGKRDMDCGISESIGKDSKSLECLVEGWR